MLDKLTSALGNRHRNLEDLLLRRFDEVNGKMIDKCTANREQKIIIGSFFSAEYSFEAAALFNPSIVPHPAGAATEGGKARLLMSLRGIGEGHVSSVTFRTGTWCEADGFQADEPSRFAVPPDRIERGRWRRPDGPPTLRRE